MVCTTGFGGATCKCPSINCETAAGFKACGADDGCGGFCRNSSMCPVNQVCLAVTDLITTCVDDPCIGKACGEDSGYGYLCPFGSCPSGEVCYGQTVKNVDSGKDMKAYSCVCDPTQTCSGKACGSDNGCGGTCNGSCKDGGSCVVKTKDPMFYRYTFVCDCSGSCPSGQICQGGACCTPSCSGKCGGASDGCGGTCTATCASGQTCYNKTCCTASCGGTCGVSAGCGMTCACPSGYVCAGGMCVNGSGCDTCNGVTHLDNCGLPC